MQSQVESGTELIARLNNRRNFSGHGNALFPEGLRDADVMEIVGGPSTGKTILLSQLLAECILPDYHETIQIKGCDTSAVLINTDHHFQTGELVESMENTIDAACATTAGATKSFDKMSVIRNSLRNLHVIDCYDSEQLALTLRTLDEMFLDKGNVSLVAIDSITAYYWQDHEDSVITVDAYVKMLLKLITMHTTRFNVVTIYTRLCESNDMKHFANRLPSNLDYRVRLSRMEDSRNLSCTLESKGSAKEICCSISTNGIKLQTHEGLG